MEAWITQLNAWYKTPLGQEVLQAKCSELSKALTVYHDWQVLQLGGPHHSELIDKTKVKRYFRLDKNKPIYPYARDNFVQAEYENLPIAPDSIHLVIIDHILEFHTNPQAILEEAQKIIAPEGYIMILGFNPFSVWGIHKLFRRDREFPWYGKFYSARKLCQFLREAHFIPVEEKTLFFRLPLQNAQSLHKSLFLEITGRILWANWGAINLIVAKKQVNTLTPLPQYERQESLATSNAILKPMTHSSKLRESCSAKNKS